MKMIKATYNFIVGNMVILVGVTLGWLSWRSSTTFPLWPRSRAFLVRS